MASNDPSEPSSSRLERALARIRAIEHRPHTGSPFEFDPTLAPCALHQTYMPPPNANTSAVTRRNETHEQFSLPTIHNLSSLSHALAITANRVEIRVALEPSLQWVNQPVVCYLHHMESNLPISGLHHRPGDVDVPGQALGASPVDHTPSSSRVTTLYDSFSTQQSGLGVHFPRSEHYLGVPTQSSVRYSLPLPSLNTTAFFNETSTIGNSRSTGTATRNQRYHPYSKPLRARSCPYPQLRLPSEDAAHPGTRSGASLTENVSDQEMVDSTTQGTGDQSPVRRSYLCMEELLNPPDDQEIFRTTRLSMVEMMISLWAEAPVRTSYLSMEELLNAS